jgi:hypothetical protein
MERFQLHFHFKCFIITISIWNLLYHGNLSAYRPQEGFHATVTGKNDFRECARFNLLSLLWSNFPNARLVFAINKACTA